MTEGQYRQFVSRSIQIDRTKVSFESAKSFLDDSEGPERLEEFLRTYKRAVHSRVLLPDEFQERYPAGHHPFWNYPHFSVLMDISRPELLSCRAFEATAYGMEVLAQFYQRLVPHFFDFNPDMEDNDYRVGRDALLTTYIGLRELQYFEHKWNHLCPEFTEWARGKTILGLSGLAGSVTRKFCPALTCSFDGELGSMEWLDIRGITHSGMRAVRFQPPISGH